MNQFECAQVTSSPKSAKVQKTKADFDFTGIACGHVRIGWHPNLTTHVTAA